MARSWADDRDGPGIAAAARAGRGLDDVGAGAHHALPARRRARPSAAVRRRRALALLAIVALGVVGLLLASSLLASDDDAFSGVWWEPSSGRRIEIARDGDGYALLYGAERRPFAAERRGDDLVIAAPLGGDIVVRSVASDRLELVDGGRSTTLRPAPEGS